MRRTITLLIMLILTIALAGCRAPATDEPSGDADVTIEISASNYAYSPEIIRVQNGQIVRIELSVVQGNHDWVVDEFDAATQVVTAGRTTAVEFWADQSGEFEFYCSVSDHRALGMVGTLIVED